MTQIDEIIKSYNSKTIDETKFAIRELLQKIVLIGLSKGDFFNYASFYGGTALRIFYDLNRYSEDLDFTLNLIDESFKLDPFIDKIKEVGLAYGLNLDISTKTKKIESPIESAFAKLNTYQTFISLNIDNDLIKSLHKDELIKVKFEIDCSPALGFTKEIKWLDTPEFCKISVLDLSSLFAGKIHAILCRNYKNTIKGRDYYDFLFYIQKRIHPNMEYLKNKLIDTGKISLKDEFNIEILKEMLIKRFNEIDFEEVKKDASKFVLNGEDLSYYSKELFIQMVDKI